MAGEHTVDRAAYRQRPHVDTDAASKRSLAAAGVSLGTFMLAMEGNRLVALTSAGTDVPPLSVFLLALVVLGAVVARLTHRPACRTAALPYVAATACACSLGLLGTLWTDGIPATGAPHFLVDLLYTVTPVALAFFWAQRALPLGKDFAVRSFGLSAIVLGCLSLLTLALEQSVAIALVVAAPLVGGAALATIDVPEAQIRASEAGEPIRRTLVESFEPDRRAQEQGTAPGMKRMQLLLALMGFLCYALIFGNVHFSWLDLQDSGAMSTCIQLGASVGTILCGCAALSLARLYWGRAFESIMHLLIAAFALVALWLSTFATSGYQVFAYLVLLNVAQKLTFLLMLLFAFDARGMQERAALWALVYYAFFAGTCVSSLVASAQIGGLLNVVAAAALAVVFAADIATIALLYGSPRSTSNELPRDADSTASGSVSSPEPTPTVPSTHEATTAQSAAPKPDALPYTCHLIACRYELTRREEEILQLLVHGRTAARISETLCISVATTRTHLRNIYAKLGVHSQQDILDLYDSYLGGNAR